LDNPYYELIGYSIYLCHGRWTDCHISSTLSHCPIPPQIQQWLNNERREAAARQQLEARPNQRPTENATTASTHKTVAAPTRPRRNNSGISPNGVVDMTQGTIRVHRTGPPHVDHPVFFPHTNALMREGGIRIVNGTIYAPEGINKFLKCDWESLLKKGKPYNSNVPPSTSSDDSDSTPPKRKQRKPAIAQKNSASKQQTANW